MLASVDWFVIGGYLAGLIALSVSLSRVQSNVEDYFVASNTGGPISIALSVMATQCSTNSILGAPAFVAFVVGGGLVWLQYELALPLAMIFIAIFLIPVFHRQRLISVYLYLGRRFDDQTQLLISGSFSALPRRCRRHHRIRRRQYGVGRHGLVVCPIGRVVWCDHDYLRRVRWHPSGDH